MMSGMKTASDSQALAAYVRVSTAGQAASGIGMDAQLHAITAAGEQRGFTIASWYEDAGRSGSSMRNRAGLQAAIAAVKAGQAGGIVVAKIDRLGRSSADVLGLVERAQREGWRLLALDIGLDTSTPAGELVAAALAMAARFEYRRISERQLEKHEQLRRDGRRRGRETAGAELADRLVARHERDGVAFAKIAAELNSDGTATVRGGSRWHASTVRSVVRTRLREIAARSG
jgi:DNA invertase Pin-like site-specific DNA recombinase